MSFKVLFTAIFILVHSAFCSAQNKYFTIKTVKKGKELTFPIFSNAANNYASEKINQLLQISELSILKGLEKKDVFENVTGDLGGIYGGKVAIDFTVHSNNDKLLSVALNESSCGMTCAYWIRYFNFNSGNGDLIYLSDLFTEAGYKAFYKFVTKRRVAQLKKELTKLKATERKYFNEIIGDYERDDLGDFYISNNTLYIDGENSFSKNQKFSGIKTISKFNLTEFQGYLNDYGKSLFSLNDEPVSKFRSAALNQLFKGTIAEKDVLMVLRQGYKNRIIAEYVYLKYGNGIFMEGELNNANLTLTERNRDSEASGTIAAKFNGNSITGLWMNKDKTKKYKVLLAPK